MIGPWLVIVPTLIVLRAPGMSALASDFFKAMRSCGLQVLLFAGLRIIAFHQYWSSVAAALISLFGWVLALRGLLLMAAPELYQRAAVVADTLFLVRIIFGVRIVIGLYLTYMGWIAGPAPPSAGNSR